LLLLVVLDDLTVALKQWKSLPTFNALAQTVIVFMDAIETVAEKDKLVRLVFEELLNSGFIYANVMYQIADDPNKMESETWFPYYGEGCASTVGNIYKIDECVVTQIINEESDEIKTNVTLNEFNSNKYPKISNTLHGCPLTVSTVIWEPFVVGNDTVDSGLEILMLKAITSQMDLHLKFNVLGDEVATAKISDDNKTGIYSDLLQK
jgi:hypothetical protein